MTWNTYEIIFLCFLSAFVGFVLAAILAVPRAPHLRSTDEYLRESLKSFRYLFGRDIKDMQHLLELTIELKKQVDKSNAKELQ